jgi:hypothetical protein
MTAEARAAAAEACRGCKAVLGALTEPLLAQLGPAVLKAARKVETPQNSSSSGMQAGRAGWQDAQHLADAAMSCFGGLIVQFIMHGEQAAASWWWWSTLWLHLQASLLPAGMQT